MKTLNDLEIKIFADGADKSGILKLYKNPLIKGFTTNPTLMRKSGVTDYRSFARDILSLVPDRSFSFEVLADEFDEMERQALDIAGWSENVYVKIPIMNTSGELSHQLIKRLLERGVKLNITAVMSLKQVNDLIPYLSKDSSCYVSVFAGRVADTSRDPVVMMSEILKLLKPFSGIELIWASPRELLNVFQADSIGCHIITVTHDILNKIDFVGKDLDELSLETVKMFYNDAIKENYTL